MEIEVLKSDWITTSNQSNCMGDQVLEVSGTKFMPRCINSTDDYMKILDKINAIG